MRINAFRIKNYRSIIDTGLCYLSADHITALIGQNESGKTSVLEALRSFYEGWIDEDVLRSDLSFPEISCEFEADQPLSTLLNMELFPDDVRLAWSEKNTITMVRRWADAQTSVLSVADPDLETGFANVLQHHIQADVAIRNQFEDPENTRPELGEYYRHYQKSCEVYDNLEQALLNTSHAIRDTDRPSFGRQTTWESRRLARKTGQLRDALQRLETDLVRAADERDALRESLWLMLAGADSETAVYEGRAWADRCRNFPGREETARLFFPLLPVFSFFEDFSSLLPNRIDLEDLMVENRQTEGYQAARNFLTVAGLDAGFFREKNHRILKQKIENLNSDITIDFQDYWRQQVGRNDKIRLNFELEHYDHTVPGKSGKPYLEFWVKDKQERLYPKQRSRGVRWFLSFYLELKATARIPGNHRILLIDEPGLSLHARAQEDVLKVFEDLRQDLQVIYCTHSPHLIDTGKLYRIIAVQRANECDGTGETRVLDTRMLNSASADTLAPVYSLMGARLSDTQFLYPENNIIVSDLVTHCYLDALMRLKNFREVHLIPASGSVTMTVLANLLYGWKIGFGMLGFDNPEDREAHMSVINTTARFNPQLARSIRIADGFPGVVDLFSTLDFKQFILEERVGITETHTSYIEHRQLSPLMLATRFCNKINQQVIKWEDFDTESREHLESLFTMIREISLTKTAG
jgi:ABC-type ATPase involved in cell division